MIIRRAYRGATLEFKFGFVDSMGASYVPNAVELRLAYEVDGVPTVELVTANWSAFFSTWLANWDSSPADAPQQVQWDARSKDEPFIAVVEGNFLLMANAANPGAN